MIKVFLGEDRARAKKAILKFLGDNYEVFDGENMTSEELPGIFKGVSLFDNTDRKILLKNIAENTVVWAEIPKYLDTTYDVAIWETKIDKKTATYKTLKAAGVVEPEFEKKNFNGAVFGLLDLALRNGSAAVKEAEKMENTQDPYMLVGLMTTQMLKKYNQSKGGARERRQIKALAKLDMEMKSAPLDPWLLIKSFLLQIGK